VKKTVTPSINRPTAPATAAQKPVPTKPRDYDRIDNSKLNLQALAWSDDAARRMVVINGRIVHEGESVDGYQVLKIRREDVVVDQGGKSWRLEFGLQQ
jgi:type II secretory pathway component PulC